MTSRPKVRPWATADKLRCVQCDKWLPDEEFSRDRSRTTRRGRTPRCRPCSSDYAAERYQAKEPPPDGWLWWKWRGRELEEELAAERRRAERAEDELDRARRLIREFVERQKERRVA